MLFRLTFIPSLLCSYLLSQRLVKVVTTLWLELSFLLARLASKDTFTALSQTIPCVLDNQEVLAEVTEQPRFLPWKFDTLAF